MSLEQEIVKLTQAVEALTASMNTGLVAPPAANVKLELPQVLGMPESDDIEEPTSADVDVMGRVWDSRIHNSNHKKYASGPHLGKWQYRKGVDEEFVRILEAGLEGREPSRTPLVNMPAPPVAGKPSVPGIPQALKAPQVLPLVWPADFGTVTGPQFEELARGWISQHGDSLLKELFETVGLPLTTKPSDMSGAEYQEIRTWLVTQMRAKAYE